MCWCRRGGMKVWRARRGWRNGAVVSASAEDRFRGTDEVEGGVWKPRQS